MLQKLQYVADRDEQKIKTLKYIFLRKDYAADCKTYACITATLLLCLNIKNIFFSFFAKKIDVCTPVHVAVLLGERYYDFLAERKFSSIAKKEYLDKYKLVEVQCTPIDASMSQKIELF